VAALSGFGDLRRFDTEVRRTLAAGGSTLCGVVRRRGALSSRFGSLVFTGVEDDPETLGTLARMGFRGQAPSSSAIRAWHHGRIAATNSPRGRELFTRLAPE
jgi:glutamate-ammonia-ligase adenylyltransferase